MEFLYLIIAIIIAIVLSMLNAERETRHHLNSSLSVWTFIGGGVATGLLVLFFKSLDTPEPTAIDVYRGRTTLEITEVVKDSNVIERDSIVVFK